MPCLSIRHARTCSGHRLAVTSGAASRCALAVALRTDRLTMTTGSTQAIVDLLGRDGHKALPFVLLRREMAPPDSSRTGPSIGDRTSETGPYS